MAKEELNNKPSTAEELTKKEKDENDINKLTGDNKPDEQSIHIEDEYKFGWSSYSETTNGRFAMIGFLAIILIELLSQQSFLKWAGILLLIIESRTVISRFLFVCSNCISAILIF